MKQENIRRYALSKQCIPKPDQGVFSLFSSPGGGGAELSALIGVKCSTLVLTEHKYAAVIFWNNLYCHRTLLKFVSLLQSLVKGELRYNVRLWVCVVCVFLYLSPYLGRISWTLYIYVTLTWIPIYYFYSYLSDGTLCKSVYLYVCEHACVIPFPLSWLAAVAFPDEETRSPGSRGWQAADGSLVLFRSLSKSSVQTAYCATAFLTELWALSEHSLAW